MRVFKLSVLLVLCLCVVLQQGCKSSGSKPSNPFAQNQTVPPLGTFSSQESYLGQTPGAYTPQTPATTYPGSGSVSPAQPVNPTPANVPVSSTNPDPNGQEASLFASAKTEADWQPVEVVTTGHTAFQAMEAKANTDITNTADALNSEMPESVVVGTTHVVTTIVDDAQPAAKLSEPQLLYAGKYTE